jgi:hypothetical protein
MIPAIVFHGIVPCVAITSSFYRLASISQPQTNFKQSSIHNQTDERNATQRSLSKEQKAGNRQKHYIIDIH